MGGNGDGHTDHRVVTCADQTHHLCALVSFEVHQDIIKPYKTSLLGRKILSTNTSFAYFLKP